MDNHEKHTEDPLNQYINPERIEKAPEGFTSKVMALIELEKIQAKVSERTRTRTLIPYVFSGFILILTFLALLLPGSESKSLAIPALDFIGKFKITLPEVDLGSLFSVNIPSVLIYGIIGILLLTLLDKALYGVFHSGK